LGKKVGNLRIYIERSGVELQKTAYNRIFIAGENFGHLCTETEINFGAVLSLYRTPCKIQRWAALIFIIVREAIVR
jgi:hypothetical protein